MFCLENATRIKGRLTFKDWMFPARTIKQIMKSVERRYKNEVRLNFCYGNYIADSISTHFTSSCKMYELREVEDDIENTRLKREACLAPFLMRFHHSI